MYVILTIHLGVYVHVHVVIKHHGSASVVPSSWFPAPRSLDVTNNSVILNQLRSYVPPIREIHSSETEPLLLDRVHVHSSHCGRLHRF